MQLTAGLDRRYKCTPSPPNRPLRDGVDDHRASRTSAKYRDDQRVSGIASGERWTGAPLSVSAGAEDRQRSALRNATERVLFRLDRMGHESSCGFTQSKSPPLRLIARWAVHTVLCTQLRIRTAEHVRFSGPGPAAHTGSSRRECGRAASPEVIAERRSNRSVERMACARVRSWVPKRSRYVGAKRCDGSAAAQ